jgi:tRNA nucleotidyltransferase/poly(A) polymerase
MALSDRKISEKILKDRHNEIVFAKGRGNVYLVGGYVRDMVRGVRSHDRDYIVSGDSRSFVTKIRRITGGTIVEFNNEGMIRIALKGGDTLDFSKPQGTLEEDLSKRDFTVNAIAWSPRSGIVDFHNGVDDIQKRIVRALSRENFIADPLRMLRAYRIATELEASIEKKTRLMIKSLQNTIHKASPERITLELFRLLNSGHSTKYLRMALFDGVLTTILSLDYNVLELAIRAVSHLEKTYIKSLPRHLKVTLNRIFSQNLTWKGLLCLETLLAVEFFSDKTMPLLAMSNAVHKRIVMARNGMMALRGSRNIDRECLFDIFISAKDAVIDVLIVSNMMNLLVDHRRFLKIIRNGFLSSEEIVDISGLQPSARLGEIILMIKKAQFAGKITSKKQALSMIKAVVTAENTMKSQKTLCSGDN